MSSVAYCCQTPFINVSGPLPAKSCDDVCAAAGLVCTTTAPISDGFGGPVKPLTVLAEYMLGPSSKYITTYRGCSIVPAPSIRYRGKDAPLKSDFCGCADPRSTLPPPPP